MAEENFKSLLRNRRSFYKITAQSTLSDVELEQMLRFVAEYVPSAFNSQTTRLVLLTGEAHQKLWGIVKKTLQEIVPPEVFNRTVLKIDAGFASGYGTILFFEDRDIIHALQDKFPVYAANFSVWSEQTNAMHQLVVWMMLEEAGMGASLQHYNPLIDETVRNTWNLPTSWRLIAEMPFGVPAETPEPKEKLPLDNRVLFFRT